MCSRHIPSVFQYNREKGHRSGHPASWHPNTTLNADEEVFGLTERRPGTGMDPMELCRQWFEGMQSMRQQVMGAVDGAGGSGDADPREMWRKWFDATVEGWEKSAQL